MASTAEPNQDREATHDTVKEKSRDEIDLESKLAGDQPIWPAVVQFLQLSGIRLSIACLFFCIICKSFLSASIAIAHACIRP